MILGGVGVVGGVISSILGGWDAGIAVLMIFMGIDYISGLVAASRNRSQKTESGGLDSRVGWIGIWKKIMTLLMVVVAACLDWLIGSAFIRDAVVIAYIVNELLSIVENVGLIGVGIPEPILKALDTLNKKNKKE